MSLPVDARTKPVDVKVHVTTGAGMDIAWADGHHSHYEFGYLRDHCPCALCNEEHGHRPQPAAANPLPLYKPRSGARAASAVGHYAVQFDFNDGHSTGIFSFEYLRQICPCDDCRRGASAAG
jgi:DUF971 family protein